ncbi:MAG: hypothetical protein RLZZ157_188 [Pseudomonadota bacterium]|jgi:uncharacterized protein YciI
MPLFTLTCWDKPDHLATRLATRPKHLEYVRGFAHAVKLAGPLLDDAHASPIGSHLIVDFPSKADAQAFADNDPYALAGLFERRQLSPFSVSIGLLANP